MYVLNIKKKMFCEEFLEDRKQLEKLLRRLVDDRRPQRSKGAGQSGLGLREAVGGRVRK